MKKIIIFEIAAAVIIVLFASKNDTVTIKRDVPDISFKYETDEDIFYNSYPLLSDNIKAKIIGLKSSWEDFKLSITEERDYSQELMDSEFISRLKEFFTLRESTEISLDELSAVTEQSDMTGIECEMRLNGINYNLRAVGYNADLGVKTLSNVFAKSKWIFMQIWNEEEFYCYVISEGGYKYLLNFEVMDFNGTPVMVIIEREPYLIGIYAYGFNGENIYPVEVFEKSYSNDYGWKIDGDGTYINIQDNVSETGEVYYKLSCEIDNENNRVIAYRYTGEGEKQETVIRFKY